MLLLCVPVRIFGGFPLISSKTCRGDTSEHGLAGMVVLGWQLDLMILEVFSNLWFYDSMIFLFSIKKFKTKASLHRQTFGNHGEFRAAWSDNIWAVNCR